MFDFKPSSDNLHRRFLRTTSFMLRTLLEIWWWEIVLPYRLRLGILNRNAVERRKRWAEQYRLFALQLGGVWIKLGQFFSSRADILPPYITDILATLQDEVEPVPWQAIEEQIIRELGGAPEQFFLEFKRQPQAAASLGQVHFATLPEGEQVAVKVQRPGIRSLIEVDLRALRWVLNWLNTFSFIRRRANLDALYEEFATTLYLELDYVAEARHAEKFAENFADDPQVDLPTPYWPLTTMRVLTLERVDGIKINNFTALEQAGISRAEVAKKIFEVYLKQVYDDGFFHADPHPGNLFVRPHSVPSRVSPKTNSEAAGKANTPFDLIFIDFGMVGHITDRNRNLMRRLVIATVQRDYAEIVRLAKELGLLLPEADNRAIMAALKTLFERYYGMRMADFRTIDYKEIEQLSEQFRDLIYDFPFQIPQDFIFLGRTLAMLSGLAAALDPNFSPVVELEPFARRLIGAEATNALAEMAREASELVTILFAMPRQVNRFLRRLDAGEIAEATLPSEEAMQPVLERMEGLEGAFNRLADTILMVAFFVGWYTFKEEEKPISLTAPGMLLGAFWMGWRQVRGRR